MKFALPGMAGSRWKLAGAILVIAGAAYLLWPGLAGPQVDVARVVRRTVVQSVVASGRVITPYRVNVGSDIVGVVASVPVREGQTVKAGELLIALDDSDARASVKQADAAVAQAAARLRQLRELQLPVAEQGLRQAEATLTNARAQFDRNQNLFRSGFVGQSVVDDSTRALDVAQSQVDAARKQVDTARPSGSDYAVAATALDQARATLEAARAKLSHTTIRAPWDGTLIARSVERGQVVQPGAALMVLAPAGETQIELAIDERNLALLTLGQKALASADAYPSQRFAAEVVYVNPGVDATRGTVEVKLRVPSPPPYLRQDMTVSADIEIARHPDVLALPSDAVRDATGPAPWVLQAKDGRAQRQAVKLGLRGDGIVEIRDGLAEGDLAVPTTAPIRAGDRLRPIHGA